MRVTIEITKKYLLIICSIFILFAGVIVYAYNSGNPAAMGHSGDEILSLPFSKLTPGESGDVELTSRYLKLNYVPTENFDAANKEYVDSLVGGDYSEGIIDNAKIICSGIVDEGSFFTCNSPLGYIAGNSDLRIFNVDSAGESICLALGGKNLRAKYSIRLPLGGSYLTYSLADAKWVVGVMDSHVAWPQMTSLDCNKF